MKRRIVFLFAGFFLFATVFPAAELLSAPYYEGKVIKMVVGSPPGGGNDRTARLLARHLPKYIPGKPTIIVENNSAGASLAAANYIYSAKPNGLTFGLIMKSLPFSQLLKVEAVRFDITKYSWLGSAMVESTLFTIRSDLPYKTFQELQKTKQTIYIAGQGANTFGDQWSKMIIEFLGVNGKMVGYRGTAESVLALERKEVDASVFSFNAARPYLDRGLVRPVLRTRILSEGVEHLPNGEDLTDNKMGKVIMAVHSSTGLVAKPFIAPPGIPPELLNILKEGFSKALKDPVLQAESDKEMLDVQYVPPEECLKVMHYIFGQPPEVVKELGRYVKF
ncbi:MAG: tripartite tricarboxylate transporter substrate-binding protein [Thermodesulfobacteriota bacterium]